ncbi:MAG TPA: SIMPL domain-containing protein, partial [Roseimicrobium sp.]|nr:SIMPL domain-containing protein [Roseimicrobium sp.]
SAMLVTRAWVRVSESQNITVTGSARKAVQSDLILWRGTITREATVLSEAQHRLKDDVTLLTDLLGRNYVTNFVFSPIQIQEMRAQQRMDSDTSAQKLVGYRLFQTVELRLGSMDVVTRLDSESATLVEKGVLFVLSAPEFIYTKAGDAKVEMLAEATRDARVRAEQIATQGGRGIARLQSARMGVFQITPLHSIQTSWDGMNDTTSFEKTITSVVSATFAMQ